MIAAKTAAYDVELVQRIALPGLSIDVSDFRFDSADEMAFVDDHHSFGLCLSEAPGNSRSRLAVQTKPVGIEFQNLLARELTITMACAYGDAFRQMLDMIGKGDVDVSDMASHRCRGDDFLEAFAVASDSLRAAKVLVQYP